jgi:hypothetical protein
MVKHLTSKKEMSGMDLDKHDLAGIDLVHLEQAYHNKNYTPFLQISCTKFIRFSSTPQRVLWPDLVRAWASSATNRKSSASLRRMKRKEAENPPNKLIQEIGHFMVNSGQIHLISDNFPPLPSPSSS